MLLEIIWIYGMIIDKWIDHDPHTILGIGLFGTPVKLLNGPLRQVFTPLEYGMCGLTEEQCKDKSPDSISGRLAQP